MRVCFKLRWPTHQRTNINRLWFSDAMWHQRTWSTLVHSMVCCLMAPNHYVNLCCQIILEVLWHFIQYILRNMHTVFALLCFVVVIHWLIFPYPSGLLHWHCGNLTIAPVPAKQPWWIWINTSCEFIVNDCITTTKQSTTKPCAYFLGYTVGNSHWYLYLILARKLLKGPSELSRVYYESIVDHGMHRIQK